MSDLERQFMWSELGLEVRERIDRIQQQDPNYWKLLNDIQNKQDKERIEDEVTTSDC